MPSFSISPWLPAMTSWETRLRSRMICSTVSPPTMERRCPAKIRPTSSSICSCSVRKRRAALAMDTASSPTLKTATARTLRRMPCCVTQSSVISASRSARESMRAFCFTGSTKLPCPVTIRNWVSRVCPLEPEMSIASLGAGTCQKNMGRLLPYVTASVVCATVPTFPAQDGRRSTITPRAETVSTTTTRASLSIDVADHAV